MKKQLFALMITVVLISSISACTKSGRQGQTSKPKSPSAKTAPKKAPAATEERDLSALRPLDIVPADKVASIAGGVVLAEPVAVGDQSVEYSIKLPDAATEKYSLTFESASFAHDYQLLLWKEQKKEIEQVSGLWDEAYFASSSVRPGGTLMVIRQGDMGMEVGGDRKDVLIAIAKEAILKLK